MSLWSLYRLADGVLTGARFRGSESALALNTPEGHGVIEGEHDPLSQRVDPATGSVVDWVPPAPADTAIETYDWSNEARRWRPTPTLEGRRMPLREIVQQRIEALEARQARPLRELALAEPRAEKYSAAKQRLQAIEDRIGHWRDRLAQIDAAADETELPSPEQLQPQEP